MILPNTFLLGAAKCGTTSLTHWLSHHPDVCIAKDKEPLYFNTNQYANGDKWYSDNYYQHYQGEKIIMDNTTMHLMIPFVAPRILKSCGHVNPKFIILVREPVERAYSHWWMHHKWYSPGYARETFNEALDYNFSNFSYDKFKYEHERMLAFDGRYDSYIPTYIEQGLYWHHSQRYIKTFGQHNVSFVFTKDMIDNPKEVLNTICSFLEIPNNKQVCFIKKKVSKFPYEEPNGANSLMNKYRSAKKAFDNIWLRDIIRLSDLTGRDLIHEWEYNL